MCLVFIYFTAFSVYGIQTLPIVNLCITLCMWTTYTITELVNTWFFFLFRWMHMLVYCSSALFNKLMFWGLYWHLTAWLELVWLKSWKNTMGYLSPLPKIPVGEEGLVNTWADLYSVVQLFQWSAHKTTFESWGLLPLPEQAQIVSLSRLQGFFMCVKSTGQLQGLTQGQPSGAQFSGEIEMRVSASLVLVSSLE